MWCSTDQEQFFFIVFVDAIIEILPEVKSVARIKLDVLTSCQKHPTNFLFNFTVIHIQPLAKTPPAGKLIHVFNFSTMLLIFFWTGHSF